MAHLSPGPGVAEVLAGPSVLSDDRVVGTWARPGPWLLQLSGTGMGDSGSAGSDGNATGRFQSSKLISLNTRGNLRWLMSRNTDIKNEVQK